jgi:hypothetical protein
MTHILRPLRGCRHWLRNLPLFALAAITALTTEALTFALLWRYEPDHAIGLLMSLPWLIILPVADHSAFGGKRIFSGDRCRRGSLMHSGTNMKLQTTSQFSFSKAKSPTSSSAPTTRSAS